MVFSPTVGCSTSRCSQWGQACWCVCVGQQGAALNFTALHSEGGGRWRSSGRDEKWTLCRKWDPGRAPLPLRMSIFYLFFYFLFFGACV